MPKMVEKLGVSIYIDRLFKCILLTWEKWPYDCPKTKEEIFHSGSTVEPIPYSTISRHVEECVKCDNEGDTICMTDQYNHKARIRYIMDSLDDLNEVVHVAKIKSGNSIDLQDGWHRVLSRKLMGERQVVCNYYGPLCTLRYLTGERRSKPKNKEIYPE